MQYFPKTMPPPNCLAVEEAKAAGDYKCGCVLDQLKKDFHNKCYICGRYGPSSINVEHFVPHENKSKILKFSWSNLFWSCAHCNNIKLAKYKNLINCTDEKAGASSRLTYVFNPFPFEDIKIIPNDNLPETLETQKLIEEVFNGTTKLKIIEADNLRSELLNEISSFQKNVISYFDPRADDARKADLLVEIKLQLSQAASFLPFKRCIVQRNRKLLDEFQAFV